MEISHFLQAGENPHIAFLAFDAYAGLIDMQQAPAAEASHDLVVGAFVDLRRRSLEFVCRLPRDVQAEQCVYAASDADLRKLQVDILVYRICDEVRTLF